MLSLENIRHRMKDVEESSEVYKQLWWMAAGLLFPANVILFESLEDEETKGFSLRILREDMARQGLLWPDWSYACGCCISRIYNDRLPYQPPKEWL
jgi:hypothetical protein